VNRGGRSHARILLQEFSYGPALVAVEQADRQAYAPAVGFDDAYIAFILGYLGDLVYANMFFEELRVPPDCQYASVGCESVDEGSEVNCQEKDTSHDKGRYEDPEYGSPGAVGKKLYAHAEERQSPQEPEYVLLRLVSQHKLVHQVIIGCTAKGMKMLA